MTHIVRSEGVGEVKMVVVVVFEAAMVVVKLDEVHVLDEESTSRSAR